MSSDGGLYYVSHCSMFVLFQFQTDDMFNKMKYSNLPFVVCLNLMWVYNYKLVLFL